MVWIKRNLFFVVGVAVAVALLVAAVIYDLSSRSHNAAALEKLNEIYSQLQGVNNQNPSPGNDKINNIQAAREQEKQLRAWMEHTKAYFKPIPAIPGTPAVTSEAFGAAVRRTIHEMQQEASGASVMLPPDYNFSFTAQRSLVRFAPGSLRALAEQLGEVKMISEVFFSTRVNSLDAVQRVRVSDDDLTGPQADYLERQSVTNNLAVLTPYVITFRAFSSEIASVVAAFAASPHGFIIKGINVQPAGMETTGQSTTTPLPVRGGLQTVLNEQLLRITLEVEVVKLLPGK